MRVEGPASRGGSVSGRKNPGGAAEGVTRRSAAPLPGKAAVLGHPEERFLFETAYRGSRVSPQFHRPGRAKSSTRRRITLPAVSCRGHEILCARCGRSYMLAGLEGRGHPGLPRS